MFEKLLARMVAIYGEEHEMISIFCREAERLSEDVLEVIVKCHEEEALDEPLELQEREDNDLDEGYESVYYDEFGYDPYAGCYTWDC